jgi:hypothetical protein
MDVRINEMTTELVVTEPVGSLSPEDVRKVTALVLEHVRQDQDRRAERERDTSFAERSYRAG